MIFVKRNERIDKKQNYYSLSQTFNYSHCDYEK